VKKLIGERKLRCERFKLRYLLFEESDFKHSENVFFSLLVELSDGKKSEIAQARDFTSRRSEAEKMLSKICRGKVTPMGLPYIMEDYIADI